MGAIGSKEDREEKIRKKGKGNSVQNPIKYQLKVHFELNTQHKELAMVLSGRNLAGQTLRKRWIDYIDSLKGMKGAHVKRSPN